jgi:WD40 repeat protein
MSVLLFAPSSSSVRGIFGDGLWRYFKELPHVLER